MKGKFKIINIKIFFFNNKTMYIKMMLEKAVKWAWLDLWGKQLITSQWAWALI